jgi:hypothetical protein
MQDQGNMIHLRGDTQEVDVPVHGNVVVSKGELVFLNQTSGKIKRGLAKDYYGYPASYLTGTTPPYFEYNLLGVAMKGSKSGVTDNIPVAQKGIFRAYIKTSSSSQTCKVGMDVAGATIGSGVSVSGVTVTVGTSADHDSCRVGRVVKYAYAAHFVDFMLLTRISGASMDARA